MKISVHLFIFVVLSFPPVLIAESWQTKSTSTHIPVIELFTAEGCGLCPAADRWVEALPHRGWTDDKVIVLGFHVDYLDDKKNWVDKFASPIFTQRQRQLARLNLFQTVYTPEFFISGESLHNWKQHGVEALEFVSDFKSGADITLEANQNAQQLSVKTSVSTPAKDDQKDSQLYLAITEDNVKSIIGGGDNRGATFNHQNIVRSWLGPFELDDDGNSMVTTEITLDKHWKRNDLTLVAVVQNMDNGYVLQGLALPLKD
ncbi:hypothetical protein LCGC14_0621530 [marine sediment metagenome]|uniref:DUF1223 domain-containing protein n=1 Tax=marine sediment metagenome TaxID=412755 RepID=A0A0F9RNZ9_9ZZZZ